MSITTALSARRDALRDREAGFTLIELLVVVLIIGILAAIAIPVYLGVQNNAKDSGVKSDLVNDKTAIVGFQTKNDGTLPTAAQVNGTAGKTNLGTFGWSQSTNTKTLTYTVGTGTYVTSWCLAGVSSTTSTFYITSNNSVATGTCPTDQSKW